MNSSATAIFLASLLVSTAMATTTRSANGHSIEGKWLGMLTMPGANLRLVFNISRTSDGALAGTIDSIDQGAKDIPVASTTFGEGTLSIDARSLGAAFKGVLDASGELQGTWTQAGKSFPITLKKVDAIPVLCRPQEPKKPYPYVSHDVTYENKPAGVKIAGTLTVPQGNGPFPAMVLMTGSGPQDRDETVANHKPFLVFADYLTRRGIAVLRADDRGVGQSTGNIATSTTADFADDVLAGVQFLKSQKEIDASKIGVLGHSEGALVSAIAAAKSKDVAFIVMMAGYAITGDELIHWQKIGMRDRGEMDAGELSDDLVIDKAIHGVLKAESEPARIRQQVRELHKTLQPQLSGGNKHTEEDFVRIADVRSGTWFRFFVLFDPTDTLRNVKCPVLAISGEKDTQVPATQLLNIEAALKAGGNTSVTTRLFPGLNHLFQTCTTGSWNEYSQIEETIAPVVLDTIGEWIVQQNR